jgi:hypothetical protein
MLRFSFVYLLWAVVLFIMEVLIAAFMHDAFIRPTFGDYLVVILMYCSFRTVVQANYRNMCLAVLCLAYFIELTQYFHLIELLGLKHSRPAQWILGNGFSWGDMLAYTLGVATIWGVERRRKVNMEK